MAASQLGAPLALKTSSIGWPVELNIYKIRDDVYFHLTVTLEYLGLQKHVKKNMALVLLTSFFLRMVSFLYFLHKLLKWFKNKFIMNGSFKLHVELHQL